VIGFLVFAVVYLLVVVTVFGLARLLVLSVLALLEWRHPG